jgi:hypothetical protein
MMNFKELRKIDVSKYVEKKASLSYLSWVYAVDQLQQIDSEAEWEYRFFDYPEGTVPYCKIGATCMVFCTVTLFGKKRTSQLPIMDHRNKAIPNPDSFQVNTAMMRCLAKAISLHGIGLYIYAGEDLPEADEPVYNVEEIKAKLQDVTTMQGIVAYWNELNIGKDNPNYAKVKNLFGEAKARIAANDPKAANDTKAAA